MDRYLTLPVKRKSDDSDLENGSIEFGSPCKVAKRMFKDAWLSDPEFSSFLKYDASKKVMLCKLCIQCQYTNSFTTSCSIMKKESIMKHIRCKENVEPTLKRPQRSKKIYTVAVEGNIGSGKSTCLEYFRKQKQVEVLPEPVFKWKDVKGYNTLEMMYKDASRWSLAFQSYVQLTMAEVHRKDITGDVKMIERSLYSARYCFVENLYKGGLMPEVDYAILSEWYDWIQENEDMHIDLIVYLQAKPETCQERIKMRNRHEEQSVPLDYLESLNNLYEDWLIKETKFKAPCPVLVINTDCSKEDMYQKFDLHKSEILQDSKEN